MSSLGPKIIKDSYQNLVITGANGVIMMGNGVSEPNLNASKIVATTGTQTINGVKTFSDTIVGNINGNAATATNATNAANVTNGVYTTGNQAINGEKYFNNTISAPNIYINNTVSDSSLEIGGAGNVYIDLKKPNSDDFDLRISTDGSSAVVSAATGPLALQTNGNNRLLITQAGNIGIGINDPPSKLTVAGEITSSLGGLGSVRMIGGNYGAFFRNDGANFYLLSTYANDQYGGWNSYRPFSYGLGDGTVNVGGADSVFGLRVLSNGNIGMGRSPLTNKLEVEGDASKTTAAAWLANSDKRIKKTINTITGALEKICKVRLVKFKYKDDYKKDHPSIEDIEYLNVIAQEFAEVFPNHVKESGEKMPDGSPILQVDIHPLTIYSAAAIQELKQIIDSQNLRISELESKLL